MNEDNQLKIVCPRCGNQINSNSRCCLNCGWLNPNDPANQNMRQFVSEKEKNLYQVGSGKTIVQNNGQFANSIASNTGSRKLCFLVNYLLYIAIIILSFIIVLGNTTIDLNSIKNSSFPYIVFIVSIVFLYVYSMELIFIKSNKKWWYSLIPIFNLFILADITFKKKWLGIILLVPIIGQIFLLIIFYKLGTRFKYNGLLSLIFPIIYIPLMGFSSRFYESINYIDEKDSLEKDYKRKKLFFISLLLFLIVSGIFIFWNNIIEIKSKAFRIDNYYYVFSTRQIVNKTKQLAKENYLECSNYNYKSDKGIYYIEYADIGEVSYIPLHLYRDVISGYVIIDNTGDSSKYYVSLSDGTYGYPETLYEDVNIDSIVPYESIVKRDDLNKCINTKPKVSVGGIK